MVTSRDIGTSLVEFAKKDAAFSARRGLVGELFPYIWAASKRMSVRAIALWLQKEHGVTLSANTIARGLRNEDEHWTERAEEVVAAARAVEKRCKLPVVSILTMDNEAFETCFDTLSHFKFPAVQNEETMSPILAEIEEAVLAGAALKENWFALPAEARERCMRFVTVAMREFEAEGSKKA